MSDKTYKNVNISIIETRVPEDILFHAEEVLDQGSVSGLNKKARNEWEAVVIDRNLHFSVSSKIAGEKLEKCSCNCNVFTREGMCGHVVVLIIHLRKQLEELAKKERLTRSKKTRFKSVNLSLLLKELSREDLESFILYKARSERNFKLLLQARFIEKMAQEQLPSFIESIFPVLTKANEKIAATRLKVFLDISDELTQHFKNLIAKEDLIEAYNLIFLLLKKSFYVKYHLKTDHARFYKQHKNLLSNYLEVYKLIEAPEYKEHIINQLEELLSASYMSASLKSEKDLWMLFYKVIERKDRLQEIVNKYFERSLSGEYDSFYFLKMLEFILLESNEEKRTKISKKDMQECYRIIQYFHSYRNYTACQEGMHLFYVQKSLNHPLAKLITESAEVIPEFTADLIQSSIQYFLKYKDALYLDFIRGLSKNWKSDKTRIIEQIKEKGRPDHLIKFYLTYHDLSKAVHVLEKNITFELLLQFDRDIAAVNEDSCYELYKQLLHSYLDQHFGIHAQDFTTRIFNRIVRIGYKDWVRPLKDHLKERFQERKFLFK